ncbi:MAG: prephenate dehydratase [Phycisphaerae bacterium]
MAAENPDSRGLDDLRREIDAIDEKLLELICARGRAAREIGRVKASAGAPVYAPDREKEVLARLRERNPGPFDDAVLFAIYRELMSGSFALEKAPRIAYLGPPGTHSHQAARERFGSAVEYESVADIPAAFDEVERRHADYAVVPVENSIGGGVIDTLDAFIDRQVRICAEMYRTIHHNLLSRAALDQIERVYSKPQAFEQCRIWLNETGLMTKTVPVASTSRAAEQAAAEPGAAAIGGTLAGELYGLPVMVANIEDHPNNVTRFFVLGREGARPTGQDKSTLLFTVPDRAGALVDVLEVFRNESINLTHISSRPSRRRNWEYYFFVDAEGHIDDERVRRGVEAAREFCLQLTVLGSYPQAPEGLPGR